MLVRSAAAGLVPVVTTERSRIESGIIVLKLMRLVGPTKGSGAQIRQAPPQAGSHLNPPQVGRDTFAFLLIASAHFFLLPEAVATFANIAHIIYLPNGLFGP